MILPGIETAALIPTILPGRTLAVPRWTPTLREWKRYLLEVDTLYWDPKGQQCLSGNTYEVLLHYLGREEIDASTLAKLLNDPEGVG